MLTYAFTWQVFRPGAGWARGVVVAGGAAVMATVGASGGDPTASAEAGAGYWLGTFARMGGGFWGTVEAFRYGALMRRRLALGLADRVVANRSLLWGLASAGTLVIFVVTAVLIEPGDGAMGPGFIATVSSLTLAVAVTQWLAFFPPRRYLACVERAGSLA